MITIVGVGHVFDLSDKMRKIIEDRSPDLVCLELDERRYRALLSGSRERRGLPIMYVILSRFQQRVAEWYGTKVGNEILSAIRIAREKEIPIELIDMDAETVFRNLWKSMSLGERVRLFLSGIVGLLGRKSTIKREIDRMRENVDEVIEEIGKSFPSIKRVLIDERNEHMAMRLEELSKDYKNIIAFVGDGHIPGMMDYFKSRNIEVDVIRLRDLECMDLEDP
ncbi:MAG: hypothetical protein DRN13_00335 [Thermoplasmata archaeon]|nr:MAG: hypothetical protein DRN13_00335 [Thermoplasmata archaeon]